MRTLPVRLCVGAWVRRCSTYSLIVAAAVLATACDVALSGLQGGRERAEDTWTRSYAISAGGQFDVSNVNGRIEVTATDDPKIEVKAERVARGQTVEAAKENLRRIEIIEEASADRVRIETRHPRMRNGGTEVRYFIRVPRNVRVRVTTVNGEVDVDGVTRAVMNTVNGQINGRRLEGGAEAETVNGQVHLEFASLEDNLKVETVNGGVEIEVPSSAKADVSARWTNGGISVNGLALETLEKERRRLTGRLNGGGARIDIETTNGGITINGRS
jgi:hypothetical protein